MTGKHGAIANRSCTNDDIESPTLEAAAVVVVVVVAATLLLKLWVSTSFILTRSIRC